MSWAGKSASVFVPIDQTVDPAHRDDLTKVGTSQRSGAAWEGSAWGGVAHLTPMDALRYAAITPRLIAPNPNTTPESVSAVQAIAALVQCRQWDIDQRRELGKLISGSKSPYPSADDASKSKDWEWRLYAALHSYLDRGSIAAFDDVLATAKTAPHRAVAAVMAATAATENANPVRALAALDSVLDADDALPIDHGWLQVHKARALRDMGDGREARDLAIEVQRLRASTPTDPTALAIAAAAAHLVFTTADWQAKDVATLVIESDTAAGWWRSQVLASGLDKSFDQHFDQWARRSQITADTDSPAWRYLRAVSLTSAFAGDHNGWRQAYSLLARLELQSTTRNGPNEVVEGALCKLRLTGDTDNLKSALEKILRSGPAIAARRGGAAVDMERSTVTSSRTDIEYITLAALVLTPEVADRHAHWAIRTIQDPTKFIAQVNPTYYVHVFVSKMLVALIPAVSPAIRREVVRLLVEVPIQTDQFTAQSYAFLVNALDVNDWNEHDRSQLAARDGKDHWELTDAFDSLLAEQDDKIRERLLDEARKGSLSALLALKSMRSLPSDVVEVSIGGLREKISEQVSLAKQSSYGLGNIDFGEALTLLNMWHPDQADWKPILDLLGEPLSSPADLERTLTLLLRMPDKVPASVVPSLLAVIRKLSDTNLSAIAPEYFPLNTGLISDVLEAFNPGETSCEDLWDLMAGTTEQRHALISIIQRRSDPKDLNLLASLANIGDGRIRGTVAACLARWVATGVAVPESQTLLLRLIDDPGTLVARNVVASSQNSTDSTYLKEPLRRLQNHVHATVRRQAIALLQDNDANPVSFEPKQSGEES